MILVIVRALRFCEFFKNTFPSINAISHTSHGMLSITFYKAENIDFNESFCLYMFTEDTSAQFPPHILSRVTFVNFSVTHESLEAQALGSILATECPDIEKRRIELTQTQSEQSVRLRMLEDLLLAEINRREKTRSDGYKHSDTVSGKSYEDTAGSFLDDDKVIDTLEHLKRETTELNNDIALSRTMMKEVAAVAALYSPFAQACARSYFVLERLRDIHPLYGCFTIHFFHNFLSRVLSSSSPPATPIESHEQANRGDKRSRLLALQTKFFASFGKRIVRSLIREDRCAFALKMAQIKLQCDAASAGVRVADTFASVKSSDTLSLKTSTHVDAQDIVSSVLFDDEIKELIRQIPVSSFKNGDIDRNGFNEAQISCLKSLAASVSSCQSLDGVTGGREWNIFLTSPEGNVTEYCKSDGPETSSESDVNGITDDGRGHLFSPEEHVPHTEWMTIEDQQNPCRGAFLDILVVKALRPDRLLSAMERFVAVVFCGSDINKVRNRDSVNFPWRGSTSPLTDTADVVDEINKSNLSSSESELSNISRGVPIKPILLCSVGFGHDAGRIVEVLAKSKNVPLYDVSMGSTEGIRDANHLITRCTGSDQRALEMSGESRIWILLRNVHLAPGTWLEGLQYRFQSLFCDNGFQIFLTATVSKQDTGIFSFHKKETASSCLCKLPMSLLRNCYVIVSDTPVGLKATLLSTFSTIMSARGPHQSHKITEHSPELSHLYFLLAWFHAVIIERLRYAPLAGFTKKYELSASDAMCGASAIDDWFRTIGVSDGSNFRHINPSEIPWNSIIEILSESIYGGRVDNEFDRRVIKILLENIFVPEAFTVEWAPSYLPSDAPPFPSPGNMQTTMTWISALPDSVPVTWAGLPQSAESSLSERACRGIIADLAVLHDGQLSNEGNESAECEDSIYSLDKNDSLQKNIGRWASYLCWCGSGTRVDYFGCNYQQDCIVEAHHVIDAAAVIAAETMLNKVSNNVSASIAVTFDGKYSEDISFNEKNCVEISPLLQFLSTELAMAIKIFKRVISDLQSIEDICRGERDLNNMLDLKSMAHDLDIGCTPAGWVESYDCSPGMLSC